jgi:hypothetical protein
MSGSIEITDTDIPDTLDPDTITNDKIFKRIIKQRDTYVSLLKEILKICKDSHMILDMYYSRLNWKSDALQISVILLTSLLTCIQAGRTIEESYFENLTMQNKTTLLLGLNPEDYSTHHNMIYDSIVLGVSTYSSLALTIMRYFKWDDKRETSSELKGKFLELHNRINYQLDTLRPWKDDDYFNNPEENYYKSSWATLMIEIEKEYLNIIDTKKYLFTECDKLLTETERIRYLKRLYEDQVYRNTHEQNFKELSLEHKRRKKTIEQENKQLLRVSEQGLELAQEAGSAPGLEQEP